MSMVIDLLVGRIQNFGHTFNFRYFNFIRDFSSDISYNVIVAWKNKHR